MNCEMCLEKKRADYWHRIATFLLTIIGGMFGGIVGWMIVGLFGN